MVLSGRQNKSNMDDKQRIKHLQEQLAQRERDIYRLRRWIDALQRDIDDVYQSVTWRIGDFFTRLIMGILRRPRGITARDHIGRTNASFKAWREDYLKRCEAGDGEAFPAVPWHDDSEYREWIAQYDSFPRARLEQLRQQVEVLENPPLLSAVSRLSKHTPGQIEMLSAQIYPHWEFCLAVPAGRPIPAELENTERCRIFRHASLADVIQEARGEYVFFPNGQDELPAQALFYAAKALCEQACDVLYADEDRLNDQRQRSAPWFKPDWNPDLFYAQHYLSGLTLFRREQIKHVNKLPADALWAVYASMLHLLEQNNPPRIRHIPKVLSHRHESVPDMPRHSELLQRHFSKRHIAIIATPSFGSHLRLLYPLPATPPLVSLIIPSRDKLSLLRGTLQGILEATEYPALEVLVIDNGSREKETLDYLAEIEKDTRVQVIRHDAPFNYSQLNNLGVARSRGTVLAFLNNDLAVIHPDWLREMVSHAIRPEIGAVGAKLYYADDTLQHAGVVTGLGGMAGHPFKFLPKQAAGYYDKPQVLQNCSAVTAACMLMRREVFEACGGFDEHNLKVAFNDVDLCLKAGELGYRILWTPYAELYHLESASRGADDSPKKFLLLQKELAYMRKRWGHRLHADPCYNPNLTVQYEDYSLAWPPRRQ